MKKLLTVMGMLALSLSAQADDLLSLYQRAAQNDPVIRAARASHEAEPLARANLLPNANLSGNLDYTSQDVQGAPNDDYASNALTVQVVQPLFRQDRRVALSQARDQVKQAVPTIRLPSRA